MKVLKIDMDFKPPDDWLTEWIITRHKMLRELGFPAIMVDYFKTKRGMHFYFKLFKDVDDETVNKLQFLLGDDHTRVKINEWRIKKGIKRWNKLFHRVLYRRKVKVIECWYCGNKIPLRE